jgi:GNAT superfamily N-acetyltransferase
MEATPEALAFAEKHGFRIQHHSFESVLDVAAFDIARYADSVRAAEAAGIRFSSLVVEGNTDANLEKLFVLNTRVADDEPTSDGTAKHTFESWKARIAGSDWFYAPGQLLAIDGDQYIGLGAVGFEPDGQAFNAFTGVLPGYRGRKIAQALKLKGVEFTRACGAKTIRTSNDSQNAPMLAINTKFGYQREPGMYRLIKDV